MLALVNCEYGIAYASCLSYLSANVCRICFSYF